MVLAGLVLAVALSTSSGRVAGAILAVVSCLWLLVNVPMEGAVLLEVIPDHGLTAGDLAGIAGLLLAGWRLVRGRSHRSERRASRHTEPATTDSPRPPLA